MKTTFPYEKIDFDVYLSRYFEREDAIKALPDEAELIQAARKAIVKEQLVLVEQSEGTCAEIGDTLTLCTVSELPKFNKTRVTVSIGRGLYDKMLEEALVGLKSGESCQIMIKDQKVEATILEIKRKSVPEPTDEMVVQMAVKDLKGNLITTVADYEAYVVEEKTLQAAANVNYYMMEMLMADYPVTAYDEEDVRILGDLEEVYFHNLFLEQEGIDLYEQTKEQMQARWKCDSFKDFIKLRYDWYKIKIHQCLIYGSLLGIPLEGEYDPVTRYEVLQDLMMLMFDRIRKELSGGNE